MTGRFDSWLRFVCASSLLVSTFAYLKSAERPERAIDTRPLSSMPKAIGSWSARDITFSADVLNILGNGKFLNRRYESLHPHQPEIDLYIAYYPSQRTGATIHSPRNCLPGAGWMPLEFSRVSIAQSAGTPMWVNRYIIGKRSERELVFYWYQGRGRDVASEYAAKLYLVADSIRLHRTDGAMVRIMTPVVRQETENDAEVRATTFLQQIEPLLDTYIPR